MTPSSPIRDVTREAVAKRFQAGEVERFAQLGITVSDTETTGLKPGVNGLTEIASIRAKMVNSKPKLEAFHQYILPLKPAFRDYLAACEKAKAEGASPPPYDRAKYEYAIDPSALAVTGTEIMRERLDGPITGLKVRDDKGNHRKVEAVPFYEIAPQFLAFTQHGVGDVYFNTPFDKPFLAELLCDINVDKMLQEEAYRNERFLRDERISPAARTQFQLFKMPYNELSESTKAQLRELLRPYADTPNSYTNSAQYQCLMFGNLAANGFKARNNLDTVYAPLMSEVERERGDHSALEDVVMAARVAVAQAQHTGGNIHTIAELFGDLLHRVDPKGQVTIGPARAHRNQRDVTVEGDIALRLSDDPTKLGADAQAFWHFMQAFEEVKHWSPRSPEHVLDSDISTHRLTINAEGSKPLSLQFLKKCAYFHQLLKAKQEAQTRGQHTVIQSIQPFDSTGTVMDVVLRRPDETMITIQHVPFTALRANTQFLEDHPAQAEAFLALLRHLTQCDRSVGTVLLREDGQGNTRITIKGHQRNFGECELMLPRGADVSQAIPALTKTLEAQLKLGGIPGVAGIGNAREEDEGDDEETKHADASSNPVVAQMQDDGRVELTLSANVFAAVAMRLNQKKQRQIALQKDSSIATDHGNITIKYDASDKDHSRYRLTGMLDALNDFVDLDHVQGSAEAKDGRKPSQLIRDASWLLYRLERLPGTFALSVDAERHMAILEQRDGVDAETLMLLKRMSIPFKAYDREIKLDMAQLMENAFHWSLAIKRAQDARKAEIEKPYAEQANRPSRLVRDVQKTLFEGNAKAIEMDDAAQFWLLDHGRQMHGRPPHHALMDRKDGVTLTFDDKKRLVVEHSDVKRPDISDIQLAKVTHRAQDGLTSIEGPAIVKHLVSKRLKIAPPDDPAMPLACTATQEEAQKALDEALRFTYWLSKATGSERQTLRSLTLSADGKSVSVTLPGIQFLQQPSLMHHLQTLHKVLSDNASEGSLLQPLRAVRDGLPDARFLHPRMTNFHRLVAQTRPCLQALHQLHDRLAQVVENEGLTPDNDVSKTLKGELAWLGLLLHEVASVRNALAATHKPDDAVFAAIADAQEAISNIAYGLEHLAEDMAELDKSIIGKPRTAAVSLLRETGKSMAHTLIDEVRAALKANPQVDIAKYLQPMFAEICSLQGIEQTQDVARQLAQSALRQYLDSDAAAADGTTLRNRVIRAMLSVCEPEMSARAQDRYIQQYFSPDKAQRFAKQEELLFNRWPPDKPKPILRSAAGYVQQPDYARHQQCKTLLNALDKTREEAIDLDHALPHAKRAISHLIGVLGQEQSALPSGLSQTALAVQQIGMIVTDTPRTTGIVHDPVAGVRAMINQQRAAIATHFLGLLARNKLSPLSTTDGRVTLATADLDKLFAIWLGLERSGKLNPKPSSAILAETAQLIRKQHPLLAHPEVSKLTLNAEKGRIKATITLPDAPTERAELWQRLSTTAKECNLIVPAMPESAGEHVIYLSSHQQAQQPNIVAALQPRSRPRTTLSRAERLKQQLGVVLEGVALDW